MKAFITFVYVVVLLIASEYFVAADTVYFNDGSETKGIVVENYHNRIVLSTCEGEKDIDKASIKDILYDRREQNLLKLGDYHQEKGNLSKAYSYYKKAYEINPNYKEARDKFIFIRSALLKNPERQFKSDMARKQALFKETGKVYNPVIKEKKHIPETTLKNKIGIVLYEDDYMPRVASVVPLSSGAQSGIKAGDVIYSIWGKMTGYLDLDIVVDMIINNPSPEIALTIKRKVQISRLKGLARGSDVPGISIGMIEEGLVVKAVRPGSDSAKSGLLEEDIITNINEEPTRYMPLNTAAFKIQENFVSDKLQLDILRNMYLWRKEN